MGNVGTSPGSPVRARTLAGFRDVLPDEMIVRQHVTGLIRAVFEEFGFRPLDTPLLEHRGTVIASEAEEANIGIYQLQGPDDEAMAMRYDLTVPFGRLLAQYPDRLRLPLRRYHIGPVFRGETIGAGSLRQFTQCDVDVAGSADPAVDAEIVAVMCTVFERLGLGASRRMRHFKIRLNSRRLWRAFLEGCGLAADQQHGVLMVIDWVEKAGIEWVTRELGPGRDEYHPGVGLSPTAIDRILSFASTTGQSRREVIERLIDQIAPSETRALASREMFELEAALEALGISDEDVVVDASLARGWAYYTGPVFEATLRSAPGVGSVMGGGRYDDLVERFLHTHIPATGVSVGLDRLIAGLRRIHRLPRPPVTTDVLVVAPAGTPAASKLRAAAILRKTGLRTEVYFGTETGVAEQRAFARDRGIPVVVIVDSAAARGELHVVAEGIHATVPAADAAASVRRFASAGRADE
jgi:histidyl-tRNA synthetase